MRLRPERRNLCGPDPGQAEPDVLRIWQDGPGRGESVGKPGFLPKKLPPKRQGARIAEHRSERPEHAAIDVEGLAHRFAEQRAYGTLEVDVPLTAGRAVRAFERRPAVPATRH